MSSFRMYVIRRLILTIPLMLGLSLLVFGMVHLAPGDPALIFIGEDARSIDAAQLDQIRENLGLNDPFVVQYARWIGDFATGNMGHAHSYDRPVSQLIFARLWPTVELQALSIILALMIALPLGIISAVKQYSLIDNTATVGAFMGLAMPEFWMALLLQLFVGLHLGLLPIATRGQDVDGIASLQYYILPVIVLAVSLVATYMRFVRSSMLEVIKQDYVMVARAKGLTERTVLLSHALRNAILPVVTVVGLTLPRLVSGAVIVEVVFAWPGLGSLAYDAILRSDYQVVMAVTVLSGAFVLLLNIVVDVVYVYLDPRISYER